MSVTCSVKSHAMWRILRYVSNHHHHHLSLNREGPGAPQMVQPVSSIFTLFSTALWDLANSRPVHSLMWSCHLFLCLPCLLPPYTVPCKMFWPDLMNGRHDHTTAVCISLRWSGDLRVVQMPAGSRHGLPRREHCRCMRCVVFCGSTSFPWLVFFFEALLCGSMIHTHTGR